MAITLTEYHDAVGSWLTSNEYLTDWLSSAECYPILETPPTENSAYFGVTNWERAEVQPPSGELAMVLSCQLLIAFPRSTPNVELNIREALMTLCNELEGQRFGLVVKEALLLGAEPYDFNPVLDECETWSIRWTQEIKISSVNSNLMATEFTPSKIYIGHSPDIGEGHEDDYIAIEASEEVTAAES